MDYRETESMGERIARKLDDLMREGMHRFFFLLFAACLGVLLYLASNEQTHEWLVTLFAVCCLVLGIHFYWINTLLPQRIIFFHPSLRGPGVFAELLAEFLDRAPSYCPGVDVTLIHGSGIPPAEGDEEIVLMRYINDRYKKTVIVMILPDPGRFESLSKVVPQDAKLQVITLDAEIGDEAVKSSFVKKAIVIDNKKGAELAADHLVEHCKESKIAECNVVICEGDYHARGKMFLDKLQNLSEDANIDVHPLEFFDLHFQDGMNEAFDNLSQMIDSEEDPFSGRETFVFCANDSIALGARMALTGSENRIKIVSLDASQTVRDFIDRDDPYFLFSISQNYKEYAKKALKTTRELLGGQEPKPDQELIEPKVYKGERRRRHGAKASTQKNNNAGADAI